MSLEDHVFTGKVSLEWACDERIIRREEIKRKLSSGTLKYKKQEETVKCRRWDFFWNRESRKKWLLAKHVWMNESALSNKQIKAYFTELKDLHWPDEPSSNNCIWRSKILKKDLYIELVIWSPWYYWFGSFSAQFWKLI